MKIQTGASILLALALAACGGADKHKAEHAEKPAKKAVKTAAADAGSCRSVTDDEIAALFDRWNTSLQSGKPANVVANYAKDSVLLPTLSDKVRYSPAEKEDYFVHFLENAPVGEIHERHIQIGCNTALDAGVYSFTFAKTGNKAVGRYSYTYQWDGKNWLITSHHSSLMPEAQAAKAAADLAAAKAQAEAAVRQAQQAAAAATPAAPAAVPQQHAAPQTAAPHAQPPAPVAAPSVAPEPAAVPQQAAPAQAQTAAPAPQPHASH
ncbi:DUF4440 domain-containing protein [Conchiformibius kuhniae]|uniref:DUF4440 domain-containing protein n=1 Tax=Conchiformibius kuhniae TaxID=211502 RepID=A0A8T9MSX1_9NEIS|nr:DUF4440 domain-containing protein [Conchiformibius kuhniae]UOP04371.1 DUF4440 domain-containing protein [Conchiformibius kuhniae]